MVWAENPSNRFIRVLILQYTSNTVVAGLYSPDSQSFRPGQLHRGTAFSMVEYLLLFRFFDLFIGAPIDDLTYRLTAAGLSAQCNAARFL
jgi:hypothetical protein